jgi:hypothetical protein
MDDNKIFLTIVLVISFLAIGNLTLGNITGFSIEDMQQGVPKEEVECMEGCMSQFCELSNFDCVELHADECSAECNAYQPEQTEDEQCVQECILKNCNEYDWDCQDSKMDECDIECDMLGDAPLEADMSEEELCISKCVSKIDPTLICGSSEEGETGNEICQQCAKECVYLYEGPCLNDEEINEKEKACETCEHCYGEPVYGDSGEGYECITDIKCEDSSDEFGDDPGTGPGISRAPETTNIFSTITNFFTNLF